MGEFQLNHIKSLFWLVKSVQSHWNSPFSWVSCWFSPFFRCREWPLSRHRAVWTVPNDRVFAVVALLLQSRAEARPVLDGSKHLLKIHRYFDHFWPIILSIYRWCQSRPPSIHIYTGWWFGTWIWCSIICWWCHPSHWRSYFSRWLKPPTRLN